jgi:hypothetical protein
VPCVLICNYPRGAVLNSVLPRDGSGGGRPMPWRRRKSFERAHVHQTQHHSPRTRVGGAAPPGGRRRASRLLYSVRTPRGWLGPAQPGRVHGPKFAAGTAAGAAGGFLGHREGQKSVGFYPLGGAHQSAWSLFIHCARPAGVRKGDFWESELLAKDRRMHSLGLATPHGHMATWSHGS